MFYLLHQHHCYAVFLSDYIITVFVYADISDILIAQTMFTFGCGIHLVEQVGRYI